MEKVILTIDNGLATVTINNVKTHNALAVDVLEGLIQAFTQIDKDSSVIVAILTGAGDKAFAAGADLSTFMTTTPEDAIEMSKLGQAACNSIAYCSVPVIAAINGVAYGGGMEVALACDIRIASENAKFGQQEANWGIIPAWGGTQRLQMVVGQSDAMRIILTAEPFDAQEAYRMSLVSAVYPQAELMDRSYEMAKKIVAIGGAHIRYAKKAMAQGANYVTKAGLALENELIAHCFRLGTPKKRVEKFLAKKK